MNAEELPKFDAATIQAIADALADVLVERGLVVHRTGGAAARVLDVGDGPKARLGFDRASVERWKRDRQMRTPERDSRPRRGRSRQDGRPRGARLIPYETPS